MILYQFLYIFINVLFYVAQITSCCPSQWWKIILLCMKHHNISKFSSAHQTFSSPLDHNVIKIFCVPLPWKLIVNSLHNIFSVKHFMVNLDNILKFHDNQSQGIFMKVRALEDKHNVKNTFLDMSENINKCNEIIVFCGIF